MREPVNVKPSIVPSMPDKKPAKPDQLVHVYNLWYFVAFYAILLQKV